MSPLMPTVIDVILMPLNQLMVARLAHVKRVLLLHGKIENIFKAEMFSAVIWSTK